MKTYRIFISLLFLAISVALNAQVSADSLLRISGKIVDSDSGLPLKEAEINVLNDNVGTMTNEDGYFSLKFSNGAQVLVFSALGYHSRYVELSSLKSLEDVSIRLKPSATILSDVQVFDAGNIVETALLKIESNYPSQNMVYRSFYRETVKKRSRYVSVIEAVQDIYKRPYTSSNAELDKVFVQKGRRLLSEHRKDTIAVHVEGGPNEVLFLDLVKNREYFLNNETLQYYYFILENSQIIADRPQYVIKFIPIKNLIEDFGYSGYMYIDAKTLAFTRIELELDCSDKQKATAFMLRHKPLGLRFRPQSLKTVINYYYDGQRSHINYIRNVFQFGCDWKKRGLVTHYVVTSENLVTKREIGPEKLPRTPSFGRYDVLDKKVGNFSDPEFWKEYNILEPSESLENAVRKLMKRAGE